MWAPGSKHHLRPDGPPALLHNDFKLNNMILNPRDLSAVAVVDWDQGTRGDPLFDFATLLSYWIHRRRSVGDARHGADAGRRGRAFCRARTRSRATPR